MRVTAILFASLILPGAASAEFIHGSEIQSGNWSGGAYTFDDTGNFAHCAVQAGYNSGDTLMLTVNQDATVSVGVVSDGLTMTVGQTFPVTLYIDNRQPMYGTAEALGVNFAALQLQDFDRALSALQKGRMLVLDSPMGRGNYDLTGTYRALQAALQCAVNYLNYAGIPTQPTTVQPSTGVDQTILFQIATEMITQTGATDFQYLTKEEMADFVTGDAVYWSADQGGLLGGVQIVPLGEGQDLRSSDPGDIAFAGGGCAGELATSTRNLTTDEFQSREIRALCIADGEETEALVTKTLFGSNVLYTVLMFSGTRADVGAEARQTLSEDVAIRAASFIRDVEPAN